MVAKMMMAIASENTRKPSSEAQALKKQSQVTVVFIPLSFVFETDLFLGPFRALRSNAKLNSAVNGLGHYAISKGTHQENFNDTSQPISVLQASFPLLWIQKTWTRLEPQ